MLFPRTDFGNMQCSGCLHRLVRLSFAIGEENTIVDFRRELREGRRKKSEAHIERGRKTNSYGKGQSREDTCSMAREAPMIGQQPNKSASRLRWRIEYSTNTRC